MPHPIFLHLTLKCRLPLPNLDSQLQLLALSLPDYPNFLRFQVLNYLLRLAPYLRALRLLCSQFQNSQCSQLPISQIIEFFQCQLQHEGFPDPFRLSPLDFLAAFTLSTSNYPFSAVITF